MRLVTRGDLDGLTSAVIITMKEAVGDILLVHPQDITDRTVDIRPDDIILVMHTSGTTGRPKGVLSTHRATNANINLIKKQGLERIEDIELSIEKRGENND